MKLLHKLLLKTIFKGQLAGFGIALGIGVLILFVTLQLYWDVKPLLNSQSEVLKKNAVILNKNISVFKTMNKDKIYFSDSEIKEIENQSFTSSVSKFQNASYKIKAYASGGQEMPLFSTDLFFESVPNTYIEVNPKDWDWKVGDELIPIIIPESYLNLYNFGFAESQGLPVISKNMVEQMRFRIKVIGESKEQEFPSRIVGFSNKINSILVPETFLKWSNKEFGKVEQKPSSRILVEFKDPSDEQILSFFKQKNYAIDQANLEYSKLMFFFKSAMLFVLAVSIIIILISLAFIFLSYQLILQKNKEVLQNVYNIGYSAKSISRYYQGVFSLVTAFTVIKAMLVAYMIRKGYIDKFSQLFEHDAYSNKLPLMGIFLVLILLTLFYFGIRRGVLKLVQSN